MDPIVWIAEEVERCDDGTYLLGTFHGHLDDGAAPPEEFAGLTVDEAIAWGRARARRVQVRLGSGGYHSAGVEPSPGCPPWPPADLPPLVRRRTPEQAWKDRSEADSPIEWAVDVWLTPSRLDPAELPSMDRAVAAAARSAGASGWDRAELDGHLADIEAARRKAGPDEDVGWFSYHRPAYRVRLQVGAATHARAIAEVLRRYPPPDGLAVSATAAPAPAGR